MTNAHALARYAALCQDEGIVPIVEPEVLMDGDHDIDRCYDVTEWVLKTVFEQLYYQRVALEGMVLKPNMIVPGKKCAKRASVEEVAEKTVKVLKACVPAAVPGIAFLSGGQSDEEATAHLDAMNKIGGAALAAHLLLWPRPAGGAAKGLGRQSENVAAAQRAFAHRAMMNGLAALGPMESGSRAESRVTRDDAPRQQLYLVTPRIDDPAPFARAIGHALAAGDVAAVLLRLADGEARAQIERAKAIGAAVQRRDVALLLDGHAEIAARAGADGAHISGIEAFVAALPLLKPDRIAGAGGLIGRHDAMLAGESGADYVMFGEPDRRGRRVPLEELEEALAVVGGGRGNTLHRLCRSCRRGRGAGAHGGRFRRAR